MDSRVIIHPTQRQLVAFVESLIDGHAPISALMASHITNCAACAREVKHIRSSFELAALAHLPEPSNELPQRIVARARQQRTGSADVPVGPGRHIVALARISRIAACVAAATTLAYFSFSAALNDMTQAGAAALRAPVAAAATTSGQDAIEQQTALARALSTAVSLQQDAPVSPYEQGHRRFIEVLNRDMSAALAALERNPGCVRANQVMLTSVERQLEGLRNLYLDRKL